MKWFCYKFRRLIALKDENDRELRNEFGEALEVISK